MNTKHKSFLAAIILTGMISLFFSCKKKYSDPKHTEVSIDSVVTIQNLRNMYANQNIKFTSNTFLRAVVTMDESSGNTYKQVYIRDNSGTSAMTNYYGAISLHFINSSNGYLAVGDSIAINLNGVVLDMSTGGSLQLDSIQPATSITKIKTNRPVPPLVVSMPQLNTVVGNVYVYDAQLIQLNNVEFVESNVGQPYALGQNPPAAPVSYNRYLNDCNGNTMIAYNSGYANFAYTSSNPIVIPNNSGSVVAVANVYNTMQLTLRSYPDINLAATYCPVVYDTITQNFSCGAVESKKKIMTAGWQTYDIAGTSLGGWTGLSYGVAPIYKYSPSASNYKTNDVRNDIWLVSPPIRDNQNGGTGNPSCTKAIDFSSSIQYPTLKKLLTVWVSRTHDGVHLDPSQWTNITSYFTKINQSTAPPNFQYAHWPTCSSNVFAPCTVPITIAGTSSTFYLAFRYQTNTNYPDSTGSTYVLGTVVLK
ncbi:MAG: DUF5689 domain-containing protein [Bacteroidia bacterium]